MSERQINPVCSTHEPTRAETRQSIGEGLKLTADYADDTDEEKSGDSNPISPIRDIRVIRG